MPELNFKRKKDGKNGSWGVGLDYLLKDYWNDLDKIVEDNYYGRHNAKLINSLLPKVFSALQEAILKMKRFGDWIKKAKTIFWNGPMGVFEIDKFAFGTKKVSEAVARAKATTVVGGGDTEVIAAKYKLEDKFDHISTGGGASLEFLAGKELSALKNIIKNR